MIAALVTASGPLGLSAFFPAKTAKHTNIPPLGVYPKYLPPPHLPLTSTWHEADFSLKAVLATTAYPNEQVDLREYTMKLLSRYQYLSGERKSTASADVQLRVSITFTCSSPQTRRGTSSEQSTATPVCPYLD